MWEMDCWNKPIKNVTWPRIQVSSIVTKNAVVTLTQCHFRSWNILLFRDKIKMCATWGKSIGNHHGYRKCAVCRTKPSKGWLTPTLNQKLINISFILRSIKALLETPINWPHRVRYPSISSTLITRTPVVSKCARFQSRNSTCTRDWRNKNANTS